MNNSKRRKLKKQTIKDKFLLDRVKQGWHPPKGQLFSFNNPDGTKTLLAVRGEEEEVATEEKTITDTQK